MRSDQMRGSLSRREFLYTTVGGATSAATLLSWPEAVLAGERPTTRPAELARGVLGKTGHPVTRVSFGAILIQPPQGTQVLKRAIDVGINLVHTSLGYRRGKSCRAIGALFEQQPAYRDKVFLCLKTSRPGNENYVDRSLKALRTDRADLLMPTIHEPDAGRLERIVAFNEKLVKKGKIRFKGLTCHGQMNEVIELVLKQAGDAFDAALLSLAMAAPSGSRSSGQAGEERQRFLANLRELRRRKVGIISMKSGARKAVTRGRTVFEPHVKAVLQAGADTVLTSISNFQQVEMIAGLELSSTAMSWRQRRMAEAFSDGRCMMCGRCSRACPAGVPVGELMRIGSYPSRGAWLEHAADEYAGLGLDEAGVLAACADCSACAAACPVGLAEAAEVRRVVARFGNRVGARLG
ncbi:MAG: aldo/keto reductase [Phycisphaerae bacterium]